jgi:hypothetical protein
MARAPRAGFVRAFGWAAASAVVLVGCSKDFSGPYPCNQGFASCTTGNSCETDLTSDPKNCGGCNMMCPVGAACTAVTSSSSGAAPTTATCGAAPVTLSSNVANGTFAINSSYAFFQPGASGVAQNAIDGVPKQGGTEFSVVTQNVQGGTNAIAADDSYVYYLSQNTTPGPVCSPIAASPAGPLDAGASTSRILGQQMGQCNVPSSMTLVGPTLFLGIPTPSGALNVARLPKSGGPITPVASFGNVNAFAVDSSNVYAIVTPNGPCEIDGAPSAGGGTASTFIGGNALNSVGGGCPWAIATDGTSVYWAGNYSRSRTNDNNGGDQVCVLFVGGTSVGSPAPTLRSSIVANESPLKMVSDGTNLYLLTNDSLWRFPPDTGTPVRVAGNLGVMTNCGGGTGNSIGCSFPGGGCGSQSQIGLAVDDTSVYVAFGNAQGGNQGGTLLKVAK